MRVLAPLLKDETIASDAHRFKTFLETLIGGLFDYLLDHPRLTRIIVWEQAERWQTYAKFISRSDIEDADQFRALLHKAHRAGLLQSDIDPIIQITIAEQMCWSYLTSIPLYQLLLVDEDLSSSCCAGSRTGVYCEVRCSRDDGGSNRLSQRLRAKIGDGCCYFDS